MSARTRGAATSRRSTSRVLRPRAVDALSVHPSVVSDLTAPNIFGLEARAFRAFVREREIPHALAGRRMLVVVADFEAAVRASAAPVDRAEGSGRHDVGHDEHGDECGPEPTRAEILRYISGSAR